MRLAFDIGVRFLIALVISVATTAALMGLHSLGVLG